MSWSITYNPRSALYNVGLIPTFERSGSSEGRIGFPTNSLGEDGIWPEEAILAEMQMADVLELNRALVFASLRKHYSPIEYRHLVDEALSGNAPYDTPFYAFRGSRADIEKLYVSAIYSPDRSFAILGCGWHQYGNIRYVMDRIYARLGLNYEEKAGTLVKADLGIYYSFDIVRLRREEK